MPDILDEIQYDIERERFGALIRKYGYLVVTLVLLVILGVAIGVWWNNTVQQKQEEMGDSFYKAVELTQNRDEKQAISIIDSLTARARNDVSALAALRKASLLVESGKNAEAMAIYHEIGSKTGDRIIRELALLNSVYLGLEKGGVEDVRMQAAFTTLTKADAPWRPTALEIQALYLIKQDKMEDARRVLSSLAEDAASPEAVKNHAANILAVIGNPKVEANKAEPGSPKAGTDSAKEKKS